MHEKYRYQLFLDGLPNALMTPNSKTDELEVNYREGILVGEYKSGYGLVLNNHLHFTVKVHHVHGGDEVRIVGFEVQPFSVKTGSPIDYETLHL